MYKKNIKKSTGITLIALVITIIVLLILAGITISTLMGENGILTQANRSKLATEFSEYKEELDLFKQSKRIESEEFLEGSLTAGKNFLSYNTQKEEEKDWTIKNILTTIKDEDLEKFEIIKGKLLINTKDRLEIDVARTLGIEVNPYDITEDGVLQSSNGNLLLMDDDGTLTIPDSVKIIGKGAFSGLDGLKTIIIPSSVIEISNDAFSHNKTLEKVIFQENSKLNKIGMNAFDECTSLTYINLPESLSEIGSSAFGSCTALNEITIPGSVKELKITFMDCKNLKKINLNEGLETIIQGTFDSNSIREITIPSTVKKIYSGAFSDCKQLENIEIKGNNFIYESGMLMPKEKNEILFISSSYLNSIKTLSIPEGITYFGIDLTQYNIEKIIIPKSLVEIADGKSFPSTIKEIEVTAGNETFATKDNLLYDKKTGTLIICYSKEKEITIDNEIGIKKLGSFSFVAAPEVEIINLPLSLIEIGDQVFIYNYKIKEINMEKNVENINPIFKYHNYSGVVNISEENEKYYVETDLNGNQILYEKGQENGKINEKYKLVAALYEVEGKIEIDDNVREIGNSAFHAMWKLEEVIIPEGVNKIGNSFNYCSNLAKIEIPDTVESIELNCFFSCANLTNINIDNQEGKPEGAAWNAPKGMKAVHWIH